MREGSQSCPDNSQPQRNGKARRSEAEKTNGLQGTIDEHADNQQQPNHLQVSLPVGRKKNVQNQEGQSKKRPNIASQDTEKLDYLVNPDIDKRIHSCTVPTLLPGRVATRWTTLIDRS